MAKYVHPNMIVDSSVSFLKNVTFDSSVYLQGVTHISNPANATGTPYALVVDSIGADVQIKNIQLGTMAFETSTNYYGKTEVDGLISDLSTFVFDRLDDIDSSISGLDLLTQQFATDINDVSLRVEDIEASLGEIDTALDGKVSVAGDTMTGLLTLAAAGFSLDGTTITDIDTSTDGLGQLDTAIPTSGAVSKAIAEAIVAGVTASNGLTEVAGDIQLGGTLTRDTSIDTSTYVFEIGNGDFAGETTDYNWFTIADNGIFFRTDEIGSGNYVDIDINGPGGQAGVLNIDAASEIILGVSNSGVNLSVAGTTISGDTLNLESDAFLVTDNNTGSEQGLVYAGDYESTFVDRSLVTKQFVEGLIDEVSTNVNLDITSIEASIVRIDASLNDVIDIFDVIDASFAAVWTAIDNLESSVGGLDLLTQQHTSDIEDVSVRVQTLENASVVAWNGLTTSVDGSIGLGGTLSQPTTITASSVNTLSLAGLETAVIDTPLALVQDSAGTAIKTRALGSMAWATTTDYVLRTLFDASLLNIDSSIKNLDTLTQTHTSQIAQLTTDIADVSSRVETAEGDISNLETSVYTVLNNWNLSQDASIVDLRNTSLSALQTANNGLTASDTSVALGGTLTHDTNIDTDQYYLSVTGDMRVIGDLTVDGSVTYINSVDLNVSDNIITINYGETGDGVTKTYAGIIIDRGSSTNYFFGFEETHDTFRIGIQNESGLPADTQAVATREDNPVAEGIAFWNDTLHRFDTFSGFTFNSGTGLDLPVAANMPTEVTALMWDGTSVGSRDLGSLAFEDAADFVSRTLFDASILAVWTKLGYVDSSITGLDALTQTHTSQIAQITTDIADVSARVQTNTTDIGYLESSVGALDLLTQQHTSDITDLSTNKLDAVANLNVVGDASIFAYETGTTAYLKKLVAGAGVVVTEDVSTITISGDTASGVYKYTGTFTPDGSTSMSILAATHGLGTGPLSVTVYEGTDQVWVDVDCDATGNITLEWTEAALSGTCKFVIMG